jgi:hypothetical protein
MPTTAQTKAPSSDIPGAVSNNAASSDGGELASSMARLSTASKFESPTKYKLREASDILKRETAAKMNAIRIRTQESEGLYAGACYKGHQRGGRNAYDVTVRIQDVDLKRSFMCGYLEIKGLTDVQF